MENQNKIENYLSRNDTFAQNQFDFQTANITTSTIENFIDQVQTALGGS